MQDYQFIDSGGGRKLERFGSQMLIRPCSQALWLPTMPQEIWGKADAEFTRDPSSKWIEKNKLPSSWTLSLQTILFKIEPTSFGHLGLFPEHSTLWPWIEQEIKKKGSKGFSLLNLFGYTGAASLFAARCGASVCHVDASIGMVERAKENAQLNGLEKCPIRWIVDDVFKFLKREVKRGRTYDGVILDPPSFGRGTKGEVFKIEQHLMPLLELIRSLLSPTPQFVLLTCHTPGLTPLGLENILNGIFKEGKIESGEISLTNTKHHLPGGVYGRWSNG